MSALLGALVVALFKARLLFRCWQADRRMARTMRGLRASMLPPVAAVLLALLLTGCASTVPDTPTRRYRWAEDVPASFREVPPDVDTVFPPEPVFCPPWRGREGNACFYEREGK